MGFMTTFTWQYANYFSSTLAKAKVWSMIFIDLVTLVMKKLYLNDFTV